MNPRAIVFWVVGFNVGALGAFAAGCSVPNSGAIGLATMTACLIASLVS